MVCYDRHIIFSSIFLYVKGPLTMMGLGNVFSLWSDEKIRMNYFLNEFEFNHLMLTPHANTLRSSPLPQVPMRASQAH